MMCVSELCVGAPRLPPRGMVWCRLPLGELAFSRCRAISRNLMIFWDTSLVDVSCTQLRRQPATLHATVELLANLASLLASCYHDSLTVDLSVMSGFSSSRTQIDGSPRGGAALGPPPLLPAAPSHPGPPPLRLREEAPSSPPQIDSIGVSAVLSLLPAASRTALAETPFRVLLNSFEGTRLLKQVINAVLLHYRNNPLGTRPPPP